MKPEALLVHVPNVDDALSWYKKAFPAATEEPIAESKVAVLNLNGFYLEIVPADNKVGYGKSGTVMYFSVKDLKQLISRFEAIGATLYRGPINIENGLSMCQLEDPFGNLIGFRGKFI